jgi:hypothetical protein
MDSLAAPQDRLVEQLLSPRTQAQRRLKVCVYVEREKQTQRERVECGSVCARLPGQDPRAPGRGRG